MMPPDDFHHDPAAQALWERSARRTYQPTTGPDAFLHGVWARVQDDPSPRLPASVQPRRPRRVMERRWFHLGVIASVAGMAVFVIIGRTYAPASTAIVPHTFGTAPGERANVHLPNGARVTLAPATTLTVVAERGSGNVMVTVAGEALFRVAPHANTTFTVRAGSAVMRVLGTTFLVRRYTTDRTTRVVVAEGRVGVHVVHVSPVTRAAYAAVLATGTAGSVSDSGVITLNPQIAIADDTAWTTGHLVFRHTPVRDIVADLNRAYGVDIHLGDSTLARQTLTWTVAVSDESLESALDELAATLEARYVRSGRVITLLPGRQVMRRSSRPQFPFSAEREYGR